TFGIYEPLVIRVALSVRGAWRERCVQCDQIAHSWSSMPSARLLDIAASVRTHLMPTRTPLTLRCAPTASATRRCPKNKPAEPWPVSSAENYRRIRRPLGAYEVVRDGYKFRSARRRAGPALVLDPPKSFSPGP